MKIINLEINEISPKLLLDFLEKNPNHSLKIKNKDLLEIHSTKATDVEKINYILLKLGPIQYGYALFKT